MENTKENKASHPQSKEGKSADGQSLEKENSQEQANHSDQQKNLLKEAQEYKEKYLRLYAEFENARKRMEREKMDFVRYANEELVIEFLGVFDNLERSVEAAKTKHQDYSAFLKGTEMVMAQIYELLKKHNVRPIEAVGKAFDPHCHEALLQEETDKFPDGVVMEELQKGYMLGD